MQGYSTNPEPGTEQRSSQATYVGRHVAFKASDLTDNDVEELKQQGLTLLARDEDGDTVFVLSDDSHTAAAEEMTGEVNTDSEDGEDEDEEDEDEETNEADEDEGEDEGEEGDDPGKDYKGKTIPKDDEFREYPVHGIFTCPGRDLKIHCELDVMTACDRKDPGVVKHYMKLEYLQLRLPNYIDTSEEKGHFVYRIQISAKPTEEWRLKISRMMVEPSNDSHPKILSVQESSMKGGALSISSGGVAVAQASYSTSKALGHSEFEFEWSPAEVDDYPDQNGNLPSWSVQWTWNLKYWKGGHQEFDQEKPSKFSTRHFKISKAWEYFSKPLPELPYFSKSRQPIINLTNLQENRAEWRSSPETEGVEKIEWDVEVELFTAKLQKREWSLKKGLKTSYEAEVLGPGQMKKISARVSVRN